MGVGGKRGGRGEKVKGGRGGGRGKRTGEWEREDEEGR